MNQQYVNTPIELLLNTGLTPTDRLVLIYLFWRQGENQNCWPAIRTIARELGIAVNTVKSSITRLTKSPYLICHKPDKSGRGHKNHYQVKVSEIDTFTGENVSKIDTFTSKKGVKFRHRKGSKTDTEYTPLTNTSSNGSDFVSLWNSKDRLPKIKTLTDKRRSALKVRMSEKQFAENLPLLIEKVACSDFLCGQGERGWRADCDWLLQNDTNYVKILEGKYDNQTPAATATAPPVRDKDGKTEREKMIERTKAII